MQAVFKGGKYGKKRNEKKVIIKRMKMKNQRTRNTRVKAELLIFSSFAGFYLTQLPYVAFRLLIIFPSVLYYRLHILHSTIQYTH